MNLSQKIEFCYVTQEDYVKTEQQLEHRLSQAVAIHGTQKLHTFIPLKCGTKIQTKAFTFSSLSEIHPVIHLGDNLNISELSGYVIASYNNAWWLSYVLEKNADENEIKATFLHPQGPAHSFVYPSTPDVLRIPVCDVICKVSPVTPTGRACTLLPDERKKILKLFADFLQFRKKQ